MADPPAAAKGGSTFGFLGRKVGPLPVWAWGAIAAGGYYWWTHFGPGARKATATTATPGGPVVIEVKGPRGPAGPAGPEDKDVRHRKPRRPPIRDRKPVAAPAPVPAAAPMTATGIYGSEPVATPDGSFYNSGRPLEGEYVPAG